MAKYGMAIDLHKCVGCGACALACKTENNTEFEHDGEKYNWADFLTATQGTFAENNVKFKVFPVLCNHCTDAPCVEACPVSPKAMYKTADGITMHNDELCIGCQFCQQNCPYSSMDVNEDGVQYSVISYNPSDTNTHSFWNNETAVIPGGTATPSEVLELAGVVPPYKNEYTHPDYNAVRPPDVTEKCTFCDHRLKNGELPYCVVSCPSGARIFGDLDDAGSDISIAIADGYSKLKNNLGEFLQPGESGTSPNVYYLHDFTTGIQDHKIKKVMNEVLKVYPNPASGNVTAEFELAKHSDVSFVLYNISGKVVLVITDKKQFSAGKHSIGFSVSGLNPGTFIGRLSTNEKAMTANIVVVK